MKTCNTKSGKGTTLKWGLTFFLALALALVFVTMVPWIAFGEDKLAKEKADIRKMARDTLARLYKAQPNAKKELPSEWENLYVERNSAALPLRDIQGEHRIQSIFHAPVRYLLLNYCRRYCLGDGRFDRDTAFRHSRDSLFVC